MAIELTSGKVKYTPGPPRDTQYGLRINAVITLPNGTEAKIWGDADDRNLLSLKKGDIVQLAKNTKGNWQLAADKSGGESQPRASSEWTPEKKRAMASEVDESAKLMKYCLEQAKKYCGDYLESDSDLTAVAIALFKTVR